MSAYTSALIFVIFILGDGRRLVCCFALYLIQADWDETVCTIDKGHRRPAYVDGL